MKFSEMLGLIGNELKSPRPIRYNAIRFFAHWALNASLIKYEKAIGLGVSASWRFHYGYCIWHSALLAKKLGFNEMSVLEFGVAGGNGLVAIAEETKKIQKELGIRIQIWGFDLKTGLPAPSDYKDLPYWFKQGLFTMNEEALRKKVPQANLVLGDVKDTCSDFGEKHHPPVIGCIFFDLDLYKSTKNSFEIFNNQQWCLPRVFCYFDDIIGTENVLYNEYTGVLLSIKEYNEEQSTRKLAKNQHLIIKEPQVPWHWQIYIHHDFAHPLYNTNIERGERSDLTLE